MKNIGLQMYSFGHEKEMTLAEQFKAAADMGYTSVELIRNYPDIPVEELKKQADEAGVAVVSAHLGMNWIIHDLPYLAKMGAKLAICPGTPFATKEEALIVAAELNCIGKEAAKYGMKTGYHNHTQEFLLDDGKPLLDYVIENTDPETVVFEIDCGWASAAGIDPVAYINQHAGRIAAIHVKENGAIVGPSQPKSRFDMTPPVEYPKDENGNPIIPEEVIAARKARDELNVATGTGIVDWNAVKAAADAQYDGVLYIVEREANYGDKTRLECLAEDAKWLAENI